MVHDSTAKVAVNGAHHKRSRKATAPTVASDHAPTGSVVEMRILVVDDEVELADAVARGLRREGYAVDVAHDGESALDKATLTPYDLVCLDITMPGIDGLEVCRQLRAEPPGGVTPRVLMLTARDGIDDRITGLDHGADDYLVKPFAFGELTARVRSLLRRDTARTSSTKDRRIRPRRPAGSTGPGRPRRGALRRRTVARAWWSAPAPRATTSPRL